MREVVTTPSALQCNYLLSSALCALCIPLRTNFEHMRVIQKVSSNALLKKNQEYITNHVYCHLMYIPYTTFDIVSTTVEALVIALHQFLYPIIVE